MCEVGISSTSSGYCLGWRGAVRGALHIAQGGDVRNRVDCRRLLTAAVDLKGVVMVVVRGEEEVDTQEEGKRNTLHQQKRIVHHN